MTTIEAGCANGYHLGNPDWVAMWAAWSPEERANFMSAALARGLVSATVVDPNSSVAPELFWAPGHPCAGPFRTGDATGAVDTDLEGVRGQAWRQLDQLTINGNDRAGAVMLPGLGWLGTPNSNLTKWVLLALLFAAALAAMSRRGHVGGH